MLRFLITLLFFMSTSVFSQDCFERAGKDYGINADLLRAISFRESSWRSDALNVVSPESYAMGEMQIHSQNLAHLSQF